MRITSERIRGDVWRLDDERYELGHTQHVWPRTPLLNPAAGDALRLGTHLCGLSSVASLVTGRNEYSLVPASAAVSG